MAEKFFVSWYFKIACSLSDSLSTVDWARTTTGVRDASSSSVPFVEARSGNWGSVGSDECYGSKGSCYSLLANRFSSSALKFETVGS